MYLFELTMSNIKSEERTKEYPKRKIFFKILQNSLELSLQRTHCVGVSLITKMHAEYIKPNFYVHMIPGTVVFQ